MTAAVLASKSEAVGKYAWLDLYVNGKRKKSRKTFTNWHISLINLDSSARTALGLHTIRVSYAKLRSFR